MTRDEENKNQGDMGRLAHLDSALHHQREDLVAMTRDVDLGDAARKAIKRELRYGGGQGVGIAREDFESRGMHIEDSNGHAIAGSPDEYRTRGIIKIF